VSIGLLFDKAGADDQRRLQGLQVSCNNSAVRRRLRLRVAEMPPIARMCRLSLCGRRSMQCVACRPVVQRQRRVRVRLAIVDNARAACRRSMSEGWRALRVSRRQYVHVSVPPMQQRALPSDIRRAIGHTIDAAYHRRATDADKQQQRRRQRCWIDRWCCHRRRVLRTLLDRGGCRRCCCCGKRIYSATSCL
jgi:hypothetical protein